MAANEIFFEKYPAAVIAHQIQVRPYNLSKTKNMRGLNPEGLHCRIFRQIYYAISKPEIFGREIDSGSGQKLSNPT